MNSIRLRLLKRLAGPILLVNLAGAGLTYMLAWMPAQLAFDQGLLDAAGALSLRLRDGEQGAAIDLPAEAEQVLRANDVDAFYFSVRSSGGRLLAGDAAFPLARPGETGAYDDEINGEPVRVAIRRARAGDEAITIGVAQTMRKRLQIRSAVVRALVLLEAVITLSLVWMTWYSVSSGLQPLARMRANLNRREAGDLAPIDGVDVPYELAPVVGAFNELLGKVQAGASAQHDFLADVAHQLRTPLAGFKLQLEWLAARHANDQATGHSLHLMRLTNERMIRQTNQLLALARAEPSRFEKKRLEWLDLARLVEQVVQYFVDEAAKKGIDIGFDLDSTVVAGDSFLLRDLIDNLIDNAVRYTPSGGTVTVRCRMVDGAGVLEVEDSGPGIAPELRLHVFHRFVRLDGGVGGVGGSGLGLAIVRDIAHAHKAVITLDGHPDQPGLVVKVTFPGR